MPPRFARRLAIAWITATALIANLACQSEPEPAKSPAPPVSTAERPSTPIPPTAPLKDEIPPAALEEVMRAHLAGLGDMEQYKYEEAIKEFRRVHELAPGWIPGSINLAIALLNKSGEDQAAKKDDGGQGVPANFT
jgi:hypothetical protein